MQIVHFQDSEVILRPINLETDPEKLVIYLYNKMNTPKGIQELRGNIHAEAAHTDHHLWAVAEFNGELIASIILNYEYWMKNGFHQYSVITAPQFRGTGISTLLFQYACQWAKYNGAELITTDVHGDNLRARRFYEKQGFVQFGLISQNLTNAKGEKVDQVFYYYRLPLK